MPEPSTEGVPIKSPEAISKKAEELGKIAHEKFKHGFAEIFGPDDTPEPSSEQDTLKDSDGTIIGNLIGERSKTTFNKDMGLTFEPFPDPDVLFEGISLRVASMATPYYRYSRKLRNGQLDEYADDQDAYDKIRDFIERVSALQRVSEE